MSTDTTSLRLGAASEAARRKRLKIVAVVGGLVSVLATGALFWLFGPGASGPEAPADLGSLSKVDGTLVVVEDRRLVLQTFEPLDGRSEVEFTIRDQDAANFDIAHLKSHSSIALPTRVYFEKSGDRYFAIYKDDAPANSAAGG